MALGFVCVSLSVISGLSAVNLDYVVTNELEIASSIGQPVFQDCVVNRSQIRQQVPGIRDIRSECMTVVHYNPALGSSQEILLH